MNEGIGNIKRETLETVAVSKSGRRFHKNHKGIGEVSCAKQQSLQSLGSSTCGAWALALNLFLGL